jgi:CubicO group peptidase (beta-lactamase class C family)
MLSNVFQRMAAAALVVPAPCLSRPAAPVLAPYAEAMAQARAIVRERLLPRIPGLQVAVGVNGRLVWSEGFGYADRERNIPVTNETQFRIGSASKPLTAAAVALLYEQGRLDLDAAVQRYVPSFPEQGYPITTRQLAGHLAGIRNYRGDEWLLNRHFNRVRDGLTLFERDTLLSRPGTRFAYSSYGWNLIAAVVEGASGQDFLSYMSVAVFGPLGMTHTAPDRTDSVIPHRTHFYDADSAAGFVTAPAVDNSYKWAGGGFLSSAEDLVKFGSALLEPGLLKAQTLDLLFTSQKTTAGEVTGYGIGWFVTTDGLGHRWCSTAAPRSAGRWCSAWTRDSRVVIAILSNLSDAPLEPARVIRPLFDR